MFICCGEHEGGSARHFRVDCELLESVAQDFTTIKRLTTGKNFSTRAFIPSVVTPLIEPDPMIYPSPVMNGLDEEVHTSIGVCRSGIDRDGIVWAGW